MRHSDQTDTWQPLMSDTCQGSSTSRDLQHFLGFINTCGLFMSFLRCRLFALDAVNLSFTEQLNQFI